MFLLLLINLSILGLITASGNVTVTNPAGQVCTYDPVYKSGHCDESEAYKQKALALIKSLKDAFNFKLPKNLRKASHSHLAYYTGGAVCPDLTPYLPTECTCAESTGGGVVTCTASPSIDGVTLDTFTMVLTFQVCADPATIGISLTDTDTGLTFSYSITAGETGSVPTGLYIGIPDLGNAQILLTYELTGNIEDLTINLGIDFEVCVLFVCTKCSTLFPSECPAIFLTETVQFSDDCGTA